MARSFGSPAGCLRGVRTIAQACTPSAEPCAVAKLATEILAGELACTRVAVCFRSDGLQYHAGTEPEIEALLGALHTHFKTAGVEPRAYLLSAAGAAWPARTDARLVRKLGRAGLHLVWPLLAGCGAPVGLLALGDKHNGRAYTDAELDAVAVVASHLALHGASAALGAELACSRRSLEQADRLAAIGSLTAALAHEIRNPLVSIRTFTQLLPEKHADPEFRTTFLDLTLSEIERVTTLVGELLAFTRPHDRAAGEIADVGDCLERTAMLLHAQARSSNARLQFRTDVENLTVALAPDRLQQVLMNLVLNAIQAGAGRVDLVASTEVRGEVTGAVIAVADDGPGIDAALCERIFDPYYTTRAAGTGLGLSIARQIVNERGGSIETTSVPGHGACFTIRLPVCGPTAGAPRVATDTPVRGPRLLVAEPEDGVPLAVEVPRYG